MTERARLQKPRGPNLVQAATQGLEGKAVRLLGEIGESTVVAPNLPVVNGFASWVRTAQSYTLLVTLVVKPASVIVISDVMASIHVSNFAG